MATSKQRKSDLIMWADEAIRSNSIYNKEKKEIVSDSYNGQIAAFSVSVALQGLKPAIALYYNSKGNSEVDKKKIVELLAFMYSKDNNLQISVEAFFNKVINANSKEEASLRNDIIVYGIALKLAVRTFKFKSHE